MVFALTKRTVYAIACYSSVVFVKCLIVVLYFFQYVQMEPPTNKTLATLTAQLLQFQEVSFDPDLPEYKRKLYNNNITYNKT